MKHIPQAKPSLLKIGLAAIFSISIMSCLAWGTLKFLNTDSKPKEQIVYTNLINQQHSPKLFYKSIGNAPKGISDDNKDKVDRTPKFTVELEETSSLDKAKAALNSYAKLGIKAYYTPIQRNGKIYYKIRTGYFRDLSKARTTSQKVNSSKGIKSVVTKL